MDIRLVDETEKIKWDKFVQQNSAGSFLQSWEWGEFVASQKEKIWRFAAVEGDTWKAVFLVAMSRLKLNQKILDLPRGPVIEDSEIEILPEILKTIDELAQKESAVVVQLDPLLNEKKWAEILDKNGFAKAEQNLQPRHTLILDIRKPEEELLNQMHQKTRYNIRLAEKKGVDIIVDNGMFKEFFELLKKTMARQEIKMFSKDYFQKILQVPFVKLYLAKYEGKIIAANIMVFWNDTATYLFGASDHEYRQIMAPYLLQWRAIEDAKKTQLLFYDFWGAAPKDAKGQEEKWFGFTRFKMGFSPDAELTEYLGTYEKVYKPVQLGVYRFIRKFTR